MTLPPSRADVRQAKRVLASIRLELRAGTRHYGRGDRELTTPTEIVQELLDRGTLAYIDLPTGRRLPDYLRPIQTR